MLEMRGITKRFPGVLANDSVDFDVRPGEVHTLLGENGAGKSTLMKILFGLYTADEGSITFEGAPLRVDSPAAAIQAGIGMIHQHFMLVPTFTVTENVALGLGTADMDQVRERLTELTETYGLAVDPDAFVWQLAVGGTSTSRDSQGSLSRCPAAGPRRADRGVDPARGQRLFCDPEADCR